MIQNLEKWGGELYFEDSRSTISIGRNGSYSCIGVDIFARQEGDEVSIAGIKRDKTVATGLLRIPKKDIPELITMLKKLI